MGNRANGGSKNKVLLVFQASLYKTLSDRKMIFLLLAIIFILDNGVNKMVENAERVGEPLGIFEGFIMCVNHWYYVIFFCIGFIFILTDVPRLDSDQLFIIYRTGKVQWILGEMLQIAVCASAYVLILLAGSMAVCARYSFWGNVWSNFTVNYESEYKGLLLNGNRYIDQQVFKYYLPFSSALNGVLLLILCLTFMGTAVLFFSIIHKKLIGIVLNVALIIFVALFNEYHAPAMWISPFCHAVLAMHNVYVYKKMSVSIGLSYLYFAVLQPILIFASVKALKNRNF